MSRRASSWTIGVGLVLLTLTGCIGQTVYHHYEHTPVAGWEREDALTFGVPPMKERAVIRRSVDLRTTAAYPFRSLSLVVDQIVFPSRMHRRDTVHCTLADGDGKRLGDGRSMFQQTFPLPDISLNEGDSLSVTIHHVMARETLTGIADVGLRLEAY